MNKTAGLEVYLKFGAQTATHIPLHTYSYTEPAASEICVSGLSYSQLEPLSQKNINTGSQCS